MACFCFSFERHEPLGDGGHEGPRKGLGRRMKGEYEVLGFCLKGRAA